MQQMHLDISVANRHKRDTKRDVEIQQRHLLSWFLQMCVENKLSALQLSREK